MSKDETLVNAQDGVALVSFNPTQHLALIAHWLQQPHVCQGWGDPKQNLAEVLAQTQPAGQALIAVNDLNVGYLHWQYLTASEFIETGLGVEDDLTMDIDIFIGEVSYIGQGVGPTALDLLMRRLRRDTDALRATLFTSVENHAAIRAYEKAGFDRAAQYFDAQHGWTWVMLKQI